MFDKPNLETFIMELDDETRQKLARIFKARAGYFMLRAEEQKRTAALLLEPTPEAVKELEEFNRDVVEAAREVYSDDVKELAGSSIDLEKFFDLLPLALQTLLTSVNVPLLLMAMGFRSDSIDYALGYLSGMFEIDWNDPDGDSDSEGSDE